MNEWKHTKFVVLWWSGRQGTLRKSVTNMDSSDSINHGEVTKYCIEMKY